MSTTKDASWKSNAAWGGLFTALSALALLRSSPRLQPVPEHDSGIFLYIGSQILKGKLPFVDLWEQKPPLVFYLNALGLSIGGGSRWGVWLVELAAVALAAFFAFRFLRRYFNIWPALIGVLGLLSNLAFALEGGNLTEEYALPFQFAALWLFAGTENGQKTGWRGYLIGVMMGCAFLLKQTLLGLLITIAIYLVASAIFARAYRGLLLLLQAAGGFASVVLISVVYFAWKGALQPYWDVAFIFSFLYSDVPVSQRLDAFSQSWSFLTQGSGFFIFGVAAWVLAMIYMVTFHKGIAWLITRKTWGWPFLMGALVCFWKGFFYKSFQLYAFSAISPYRWRIIIAGVVMLLLAVIFLSRWSEETLYRFMQARRAAVLDAPLVPVFLAWMDALVNFALINVSARSYGHYFLAMFPAFTILIAFLAWLLSDLPGWKPFPAGARSIPNAWSLALLLLVVPFGIMKNIEGWQVANSRQAAMTVTYIRRNTRVDDTVLMWGSQARVNFLSGRDSPARFFYQNALFFPHYINSELVSEFLTNMQDRMPALIIDSKQLPLVYDPVDPQRCREVSRQTPPEIGKIYEFICANYEQVGTIGPDSWVIYRYRPAANVK